ELFGASGKVIAVPEASALAEPVRRDAILEYEPLAPAGARPALRRLRGIPGISGRRREALLNISDRRVGRQRYGRTASLVIGPGLTKTATQWGREQHEPCDQGGESRLGHEGAPGDQAAAFVGDSFVGRDRVGVVSGFEIVHGRGSAGEMLELDDDAPP